jgi:hypothetical protein
MVGKMKVLVACEFSGTVREAFRELGHDVWSCDLLPTEIPGKHIQGDVSDWLFDTWDLMIAHPPCTYLTVSGNRWFNENPKRYLDRIEAATFFIELALANIPKIAIENTIGVMSGFYRKPDQIIQPWEFGHEATKSTCLWLKNLPKLVPTDIVGKGERHITKGGNSLPSWYNLPPSEDRWKERSRTFAGIAKAMAKQWSNT